MVENVIGCNMFNVCYFPVWKNVFVVRCTICSIRVKHGPPHFPHVMIHIVLQEGLTHGGTLMHHKGYCILSFEPFFDILYPIGTLNMVFVCLLDPFALFPYDPGQLMWPNFWTKYMYSTTLFHGHDLNRKWSCLKEEGI